MSWYLWMSYNRVLFWSLMQSCLNPPSSLVKNREAIWVPLSWEYGLGLVNKKAPFSKMCVKCDKLLKMSERYLKVKHTIGFCVCQLPVGCHKVSNCSLFATIFTSLHFTFYSLPSPLFPTSLPHSLFFHSAEGGMVNQFSRHSRAINSPWSSERTHHLSFCARSGIDVFTASDHFANYAKKKMPQQGTSTFYASFRVCFVCLWVLPISVNRIILFITLGKTS